MTGLFLRTFVQEGSPGSPKPVGRKYQLSVMREAAVDRKRNFLLTKQMDGLRGVNGSLQLQALRMVRFLSQIPQFWYEPVRSVDELLAHLELAASLEKSGVAELARPRFRLILQLFESAHVSTSGVIEWPASGEKPLALHAVVPLRTIDGGRSVEFWNSWGSQWGRGGNGFVSVDYLNVYFHEAWSTCNARWGLTRHKDEQALVGSPKELRRVWMIQNPMRSLKLPYTRRGDSWYVETFNSYALNDDSGMEVVQVRNGYGLRMGWAFQCHLRDSTVSELRELFVIPAFRHQGIGSILEDVSCQLAQAMGSNEMKVIVHEADGGVPGANRGALRKFLRVNDYKMHWRPQTGPRATGFATKDLS
jgi:GNAT superfamily N-acetyltransferase